MKYHVLIATICFSMVGQRAVLAQSVSLYGPLADFAIMDPHADTHGKFVTYSQTGPNPAWKIAQWNIAGPELSPFTFSQTANGAVYQAVAPAASVEIVKSGGQTSVSLSQDGAAVPCFEAVGKKRPRESDLFVSSMNGPHGVQHGVYSPYKLAQLKFLKAEVTLSLQSGPDVPTKGCHFNTGAAYVSITMTNLTTKPSEGFFYQLALSRYCRTGIPGTQCKAPATKAVMFSTHNPYGIGDQLPLLGAPYVQNGSTRQISVDVLPRLVAAIENGPSGMDRDPSHWAVDGAYFGLISFGDVKLSSTWSNYQIIAGTP